MIYSRELFEFDCYLLSRLQKNFTFNFNYRISRAFLLFLTRKSQHISPFISLSGFSFMPFTFFIPLTAILLFFSLAAVEKQHQYSYCSWLFYTQKVKLSNHTLELLLGFSTGCKYNTRTNFRAPIVRSRSPHITRRPMRDLTIIWIGNATESFYWLAN